MAIIVDTDKYLFNHGKAPRGYGLWLFEADVPACRERGRVSRERTKVTLQVYANARNIHARGSSPLARGTRSSLGLGFLTRRFIPARAGNALKSCAGRSLGTVHPRSRGERDSRPSAPDTARGSSPLARGTHRP